MSRPPDGNGRAPRHRQQLPRQRKSFRLDLRLGIYSKLKALRRVDERGQPEPMISVVERLIAEADALPTRKH